MAIGDWFDVPGCSDLYYVDVGAYDSPEYGTVYVVDAERPAVVDTGFGSDRDIVFETLDELEIEPAYILPTHAHLDHAGGAGFLAERYPDADVLTHGRAVEHLVDPSRLVAGTKAAVEDQWQYYAEPKPVPEERIEGLDDGEAVDLGDRTLTAHHAPGHASHHLFFHDDGDDVVFTADAAGIWVPAKEELRQTSPPSQFDLEGCLADVDTIVDLDPDVLCFGHFGPREYEESLMAGYKRTLVEWVEAVRAKREELADDDAVVEHFVEHSDMYDAWSDERVRAEERLNVKGVLGYLDYRAKEEGA